MPATLTFRDGTVELSGVADDSDDFKLAAAIQLALSSQNFVNLTYEFAMIHAHYKPSISEPVDNTMDLLKVGINQLADKKEST